MYLLDTNAFLWFINDDKSLSASAKSLIEDRANIVWVSIVSIWEIAIKRSAGKLTTSLPLSRFINDVLRKNEILLLDLNLHHVGLVASLPFHHRDPFDRMIIAQAFQEDLAVITKDTVFERYDINCRW